MLVYLSIYVAAIIEGEAYYIIQCSLAAHGTLNWILVIIAGALGGSTGDNFWFYLLRGRTDWLHRYPKIARFEARVSRHVHDHETLIILASRFLPGLRTAIPAACAVAKCTRPQIHAAQPGQRVRMGQRPDGAGQGRRADDERHRTERLVGPVHPGCAAPGVHHLARPSEPPPAAYRLIAATHARVARRRCARGRLVRLS